MKILKSKVFIICVIAALFFAGFTFVSARLGGGNILGGALKTLSMPFEWIGSKFADAYLGFTLVYSDYDRLKAENEKLKEELETLKNQQHEIDVLKNENAWLKNYLSVAQKNPAFELADATVISRESSSVATVLTLNRGTLHGIKRRMPVITESGVLGYVKEVGLDWCKVVSIVETQSSFSVVTDRAGVLGTACGDTSLRLDGLCKMIHIAADSDIKVGDRILTSGEGEIYPYGLLVGTVTKIEADEFSREFVATITPAIDFANLSQINRLMIVKGYSGQSGEVSG